jgi:hypothetical protein
MLKGSTTLVSATGRRNSFVHAAFLNGRVCTAKVAGMSISDDLGKNAANVSFRP